MKKTLVGSLLALWGLTAQAQLTPSVTIPNPIPEYNGTYELFGQNHFFYPNSGEIRYNDREQTSAMEEVKFYTMYTHPRQYLLNNNAISFVYYKHDSLNTDSLHRIDISMNRPKPGAFLARVDTQNTCVLNYFTQWFGAAGLVDVRGGAAIACQSIWNNIDMVYTSNAKGLKMYFIVYPGGNPNDIELRFSGAKSTAINGNDLTMYANWDSTTFVKPKMYQYVISGNVVTPITVCPASWLNIGSNLYGINSSAPYNPSLPLIIQVSEGAVPAVATPSLQGSGWSTYFGGSSLDYANRIHNDAASNLYVCGQTGSNGFPQGQNAVQVVQSVMGGFTDGFLSKFDPSGKLKWSTYIGGSKFDELNDFDFDGTDIYCVGYTESPNLPCQAKSSATNANDNSYGGASGIFGISDGMILQIGFNPVTGDQIPKWLTYFGGNNGDALTTCKFDANGNLFVGGFSCSTDMTVTGSTGAYTQTYNPAQLAVGPIAIDAIIAKFDAGTSALNWFTFYGSDDITGSNASYAAGDVFHGLAISGTDLYACGDAGGTNLPGSSNGKFVAGNQDGILVKFNTSGALQTAKYSDGNIANYAVKVNNGKVFCAGLADGALAVTNSGQYYFDGTCGAGDSDGYFAVYSTSLGVIHNSFIGGSKEDKAFDIQFASDGSFYVSGLTTSTNFPTTSVGGMYNAVLTGTTDNFVVAFKAGNTNMLWGTCFGSPEIEGNYMVIGEGGAYIAVDGQNYLHLTGCTGPVNSAPTSTNFPLDNGNNIPYYQGQRAGYFDCTVSRLKTAPIVLGLADFPNTSFSFGIYPNPTTKYIAIEHPDLQNQNLHYAVYDMQGAKLSEGYINSQQSKTIDVAALNSGVYIVNVSNGRTTFSNKFVKVDN